MGWTDRASTRLADEIRVLLRRLDAGDIRSGHRVGTLLLRARRDAGDQLSLPLKHVASAAGTCKTRLYQWEQVARDWSGREFAELLRRRGPHGERLMAGHLLALAGLRPRGRQDQWVAAILREDLLVRALLRMLRASRSGTIPVVVRDCGELAG